MKPFSDEKFVYFPVKDNAKDVMEGDFVWESFQPIKKRKTHLDIIGRISFDIVGDIALVDLKAISGLDRKEVAETLLSTLPIRSVFGVGGVSGEFRVAQLVHLGGSRNTLTLHKENKCVFELDVARVYFNPRLATERARVERRISQERAKVILDMFAGAGPFSILIAKMDKTRVVHAVEKNPVACHFLRRNVELNKVSNVIVHEGDVRDILATQKIDADAIIMNLPHTAINFLPLALECSHPGTLIFLYTISADEPDIPGMEKARKVKSYAPNVSIWCVEVRA